MDWKLKSESIVQTFLESKRNANSLLDLEELLLASDKNCVLSAIEAILKAFSETFSKGLLSLSGSDKEKEYKEWLLGRYDDFTSHLLSYLLHEDDEIQGAALKVLMQFVQLEGQYGGREEIFPVTLFNKILSNITTDLVDQSHLITVYEEYANYIDVKLFTLKHILSVVESSNQASNLCLQNCVSLLCTIKFPKDFDSSSTDTFASHNESNPFQLKKKPFCKMFSRAWISILNHELSPLLLKRILPALNESIVPHLQNPCKLTDFLTNAYNKGGVLSLLALKGLFLLMDKYNLEYPDFFIKLYALLDANIINGKFRALFFKLCYFFLSSTHLASHMVAAFIKKLARLSLVSESSSILKILCLISNLLFAHPSLEVLIHCPDGIESTEDCFNPDSKDPADSNAIKSSLWEIKTLESHVNPEVSLKAKQLTNHFPKHGIDMPNVSLYTLYQKQRKRKFFDVPLAIERPAIKQSRNT